MQPGTALYSTHQTECTELMVKRAADRPTLSMDHAGGYN
jgi:hypothetical protein